MRLNTPSHWNKRGIVAWLLYPLSCVFRLLVSGRRWCYRAGVLRSWQSPVPVVVVGNLTAGGAGKTPLVIALVEHLKNSDKKVGIVTRGYGGEQSRLTPVSVDEHSDPAQVGDEAILLARRTGVAVVAGRDRPMAIQHLLLQQSYDVVICDDGLQHYALQRDIEIVVVDSEFLFGNELCLPAGPLREPVNRIKQADLVVYSGARREHCGYELVADSFIRSDNTQALDISTFVKSTGASGVHAVAAIARPEKFFSTLSVLGLQIIEHRFPDHYEYQATDLQFTDDLPVVMTEKDHVKCENLSTVNSWYLKVSAQVDGIILDDFNQQLSRAAQRIRP